MRLDKTTLRPAAVAFAALLLILSAACAMPAAQMPEDGAAAGAQSTASTAPDVLDRVTLGVGFVPSVQFAPFYVGIDKGFFAEAGLELEMEYGYENDYLKLVGTDESQFMIGSGDQVIIGRAQGLPVRYVMKWYTKYPVIVMALADAGITQPADLAGKRIGIPGPFGASYVAFRGILEAAGLEESDVRMESIGFTQAAALADGAIDAAVEYAANGPVVLASEGMPTTVISLDDYLTMPANGLVTNEKTIEQEPELVSAMVGATLKAIDYTLQNPDEAFEIALKYVPEAGGDNREINRAVFDSSLTFWQPPEGTALGATSLDEWQSAAEFMQRIGLVDRVVDAEALFTTEFLP